MQHNITCAISLISVGSNEFAGRVNLLICLGEFNPNEFISEEKTRLMKMTNYFRAL